MEQRHTATVQRLGRFVTDRLIRRVANASTIARLVLTRSNFGGLLPVVQHAFTFAARTTNPFATI
jgi:hypothetical protein